MKESDKYWNKKDGSKILVSEMSDKYLLQTLKNLEDQSKNEKGKIVPSRLSKKYHILKMHGVMRNIITE